MLLLLACADGERPPDLLVVSMDTTRADRLGAYGGPAGLTPNLDRLAAGGAVFRHAYAQATTTGPSHASLFTSRYPTEVHGQGPRPILTPETPTLAQVLRTYGYACGGFVSGGAIAPTTGMGVGFEPYESPTSFGSLARTVPLALDWLADQDGPTFTFIHGYDAHSPTAKPAPFEAPASGLAAEVHASRHERVLDGRLHASDSDVFGIDARFLRMRSPEAREALAAMDPDAPLLSDAELAQVRDSYDHAVAWADVWIGVLMQGLEAQGRLEHTILVVLADHGEQLGEEGVFNHCCTAEDFEAHVPLIVSGPGIRPGAVDGLVELVDVAPTLLELAGAKAPAAARGKSFVAALHGEPWAGRDIAWTEGATRFTMTSGRTRTGRLTYTGMMAGTPLLHALIRTAPPSSPGWRTTGEVDFVAVRDAMAAWQAGLTRPRMDRAPPVSPEHAEEMRRHGYFERGP